MTDEELDIWLSQARGQLDADIARERRDVVADFVAVIEAAHAANPASISEGALREVAEFAPILELGVEHDSDEHHDDPVLAAIVADVREQTEAAVARRRLAGIPQLRTTVESPAASRGSSVWIMLVALAAIVVGLAIGLPRLLDFVGGQHAAKQIGNQAEFIHEQEPGEGEVEPRRMIIPPQPRAAVVHEIDKPLAVHHRGQPQPQPRARKRDQADGLRDRVAELEQQARAHWKAGELGQAEANYREILSIAGRTRYADMAYGDLFTLAHQRKDTAAELVLWNDYLDKFPHGRFVEDARAGICRKGDDSRRGACWRAYLDDFPDGLHAGRARRELGEVP